MNIFFISMGCAKNSVDSEYLLGRLLEAGHRIMEDADEAQVGMINTCAFIKDAVKENVDAILDLEILKEQGKLQKIVVVGCLVNRYRDELSSEIPAVDLWAEAEDWDSVLAFLGGEVSPSSCAPRALLPENRPWSRYLKVGEGCDTFCSYCTIPMIRGRLRSIPLPRLVEEAVRLCGSGARELCLVGQDLTVYGKDIYGGPQVRELLRELSGALPKETWIRLLYLHPNRITHEFLDFLMGTDKILPYLDIPIQHIDDAILLGMNRAPDGGHIRDIFRYARLLDPLFALRTTIMVGFPGETETQFGKVLDFLEEMEIDRVGAFVYSPEEGTKAASMSGHVLQHVKEERYNRLMELQAEISQERNARFVGQTLKVLVEEIDDDGSAWGRSYRDAPEVDGMVGIEGGEHLRPGSFADVEITGAGEHDLFGVDAEVSEK